MSTEEKIKELCSRISVLNTRVQLIDKFLEKSENHPPYCEIKSRLITMKGIMDSFEKIWEEFSIIGVTVDSDDNFKKSVFEFEDFSQKINSDLIFIKDKFESEIKTEVDNPVAHRNHCQPTTNYPSIPPLTVAPFDGTPTNWLSFKESCEISFHNNPHIENIHKFAYLKRLLRGDALSKIDGIQLTSVGYEKAWNVLCSYYDGNRLTVECHLEALFTINPISKDNFHDVNVLVNTLTTNVSSLEAHGYVVEGLSEVMLVHAITRKFSPNMKREWEKSLEDKEIPSYRNLNEFLNKFCRILKSGEMTKSNVKPDVPKSNFVSRFNRNYNSRFDSSAKNPTNQSAFVVANTESSLHNIKTVSKPCVFCNEPFHPFIYCPVFLKMSVSDRISKIKSLRLCLNCFSSGHFVKDCAKLGCKQCKIKHHSLLHQTIDNSINRSVQSSSIPSSQIPSVTPSQIPSIQSTQIPNTTINHSTFCAPGIRKSVLLSTAVVLIKDQFGHFHECRALIDQGSQSNFMSYEFSTRHSFHKFPVHNMQVNSLGQSKSTISESLKSTIKSRSTNFEQTLQFFVVSCISDSLPQQTIDISRWQIPDNIILADPYFNTSKAIDIILGAEIFYEILTTQRLQLKGNQPVFQETLLGWLVGGKYEEEEFVLNSNSFFVEPQERKTDTELLNDTVSKFWNLESFPVKQFLTKEEESCEKHFTETHSRDQNGRYVVHLPLKDDVSKLGNSKSQALKRFYHLEFRMNGNPQLKNDYTDFINDYIRRGHMKLLTDEEINNPKMCYYLPHHAIIKPSSSTTKLRVVFDASAKTTSNLSLNDVLLTGPTVQQNLFNIVLRFRKHRYALTSDISKMYRQVVVHPNDTHLQRILWRTSPSDPIQTYELTTVTYGTAAAPYLATRALVQLSEDEKVQYPNASKVLRHDFYVDDVLTGADSIQDAEQLQSQLIQLLSSGGFKLHKWMSNSVDLLNKIPIEDREILRNESSDKEYIGTLGLYWKPKSDVFVFNIPIPESPSVVTKRIALSNAASIFDPLGLASPSTILAKLYIQKLWEIKSDWDDPLPIEMSQSWYNYLEKLPKLNNISFPRCVVRPESVRFELHGFADASQQAYGCCIYLKSIDINQRSEVHLLCSKTRVAPLKTVSLPRLELCAAHLLSELINVVIDSMDMKFDRIMLWSDSLITLQWIKIEPNKLKVFVANRVSQISELTTNFEWNHVSTHDNPADLVSRGVMPNDLQNCTIWWHGPDFLCKKEMIIQEINDRPTFDEEQLELKKDVQAFNIIKSRPFTIEFDRCSTFNRIVRAFSYIVRWRFKIKPKSNPFSAIELEFARNFILVTVQKGEFKTDYDHLLQNREIDPKSKLKCLDPFIEPETGLLRVGGRLQNSELEFNVKHQIILPHHHQLTELIFREYHLKYMHAGPQLLISLIRQKYWPISAKTIAKFVVRKCVTCFRHKPIMTTQIMGSLPSERVNIHKAFYTTGVDLCGPFMVKNKIPKNSSSYKVYIVCFVCFLTKAIHLEIVSELTSECFIAALKRFTFRRGKSHTLWTDNGTNFIGANKQLKIDFANFRSDQTLSRISEYCASEGINWKFIPPRAPNFGGLWESSIKSLKFHLKRVTNGVQLSFEELNTLAIQVEGILNSRPLTMCSDDPSDPEPLTPGHFLIGGPITAIPEPSYEEVPSNRLKSWRRISKMTQCFWKRFSLEYIHTLQTRNKWKSVTPNFKINDVVLICEDNMPSASWLLGVIINVIPGKDNKIRVVEIKTSHGIFKRSISKISKLPIN